MNLKQWVLRGGTLWLSAGAASRDEFNRPLDTLDDLLPAARGEAIDLQKHVSSGRYLAALSAKDEVRWDGGAAEVLAVAQRLSPRADTAVLATFKDKSPALVRGKAGRGAVYSTGCLPALAYVKAALDTRNALQQKVTQGAELNAAEQKDAALLERTANPWKFPAAVRNLILSPVRAAKVVPPIACNVPLVDAVLMQHEQGLLIPVANYTAAPVEIVSLRVRVTRPIGRVESAQLGKIAFRQPSPRSVELELPLENNDFVKLLFK